MLCFRAYPELITFQEFTLTPIFQVHPELNTQGIALADLTQRAQIGQKHKLSISTPLRITPAKKRIKVEPVLACPPMIPKSISLSPVKSEIEGNDYSHTIDEAKHIPVPEIDNRFADVSPIKSEPVDGYEIHQSPKKKM